MKKRESFNPDASWNGFFHEIEIPSQNVIESEEELIEAMRVHRPLKHLGNNFIILFVVKRRSFMLLHNLDTWQTVLNALTILHSSHHKKIYETYCRTRQKS